MSHRPQDLPAPLAGVLARLIRMAQEDESLSLRYSEDTASGDVGKSYGFWSSRDRGEAVLPGDWLATLEMLGYLRRNDTVLILTTQAFDWFNGANKQQITHLSTMMASQEDIQTYQGRISAYRNTLKHYLDQLALVGRAHIPPVVSHGIQETRESIRGIKSILRSWNVVVEDHPDDEEILLLKNTPAYVPPASSEPVEQASAETPAEKSLSPFETPGATIETVKQLSRLLNTADSMLDGLEEMRRDPGDNWQRRLSKIQSTYEKWFPACIEILPDNVQQGFIGIFDGTGEYEEGIKSHFEKLASSKNRFAPYYSLKDDIESQRELLFRARKRLPTGVSSVSREVQTTIAQLCSKRAITTINHLFENNGCQSEWWIVPFQEEKTKTSRHVYGWFDGISLYAPDQESTIAQKVCKTLIEQWRPTEQAQTILQRYLDSFHILSLQAILASYTIHSTVRLIADPMIAVRQYREAILNVYTALNETIKTITGRFNLNRVDLIREVMSPDHPVLQFSTHKSEQVAYMEMFVSAFVGIQEPRMHRLAAENDVDEVVELLLYASLLFRLLDKAERVTTP